MICQACKKTLHYSIVDYFKSFFKSVKCPLCLQKCNTKKSVWCECATFAIFAVSFVLCFIFFGRIILNDVLLYFLSLTIGLAISAPIDYILLNKYGYLELCCGKLLIRLSLWLMCLLFFVSFLFFYFKKRNMSPNVDTIIVNTVMEESKKYPMMASNSVRIDSVIPGPGRRIEWLSTMVNINSASTKKMSSTEKDVLIRKLREFLIIKVHQNPKMEIYKKYNIELIWSYRTNDGVEFIKIVIQPGDY